VLYKIVESAPAQSSPNMKIWTSEHVFNHNWETVTTGQWRKYPNPHNTAVLGTDVVDRRVEEGVLHSHRIITSDWGLSSWVQNLIGTNRVCYAEEHSTVDPRERVMKMQSRNLTFCNFVAMEEKMSYTPHPEDKDKTLLKQETVVTVQGVPLTSYMEQIIVNTVSSNAGKGRAAMEWVVDKLGQECRALNISSTLDKLENELVDLKHTVAESLITPARVSIGELQKDLKKVLTLEDLKKLGSIAQPPMLKAEQPLPTFPSKSL